MNKITIQDDRTTHIVVYVNWENEEVLSEAEYETKLDEETIIAAAESNQFGLWLNEHYTAYYIWDMGEEEIEDIKSEWLKYCREYMKNELGYERRVLI